MIPQIRKHAIRMIIVVLCAISFGVAEDTYADQYRVSAFAPINKGDVARAQTEALNDALDKAILMALADVVPEEFYDVLTPLFEKRILTRTEKYISNYKIENQDVSDLAYTVHLMVSVDLEGIKRRLFDLGIAKGTGGPPLAVIIVTVSMPVTKEQVKVLGERADEIFARVLGENGITVIPPPEGDFNFRVMRPPQVSENLAGQAAKNMADLSVGVLFKMNGEARWTKKDLTAPVTVSYQVLDAHSGSVTNVGNRDLTLVLDSKSGEVLEGELNEALSELAANLVSDMKPFLSTEERKENSFVLSIAGKVSPAALRELTYRLTAGLGKETSLMPARYAPGLVSLTLLTDRTHDEVSDRLADLRILNHPVEYEAHERGFSLTLSPDSVVPAQVREFGEEVSFYRRVPAPGIENPDDLRKKVVVPWHEKEENGSFALANKALAGEGILGNIDPSRDRDLFRFQIPAGAQSIKVTVEQTGPGEIRPRVRIFSGSGRLLMDRRARTRGRGLFLTMPVDPGLDQIVLSVEDDLGRYVSKFPYVLSVGVAAAKK